jgi:hypothetical protein
LPIDWRTIEVDGQKEIQKNKKTWTTTLSFFLQTDILKSDLVTKGVACMHTSPRREWVLSIFRQIQPGKSDIALLRCTLSPQAVETLKREARQRFGVAISVSGQMTIATFTVALESAPQQQVGSF